MDQLRDVTLKAQAEADLPDELAARIFLIAEDPERYRSQQSDIKDLIEQICQYDTYAQTGYIGMGVDALILSGTLDRIEYEGSISIRNK